MKVNLKQSGDPDEVTHFRRGKFETETFGGMTMGCAIDQLG